MHSAGSLIIIINYFGIILPWNVVDRVENQEPTKHPQKQVEQ
jgi:hypothetical protein